ncbi:hypothetical protein B0J14DRAFT_642773 [Halenospora varia]|nr:hypothetical protein B0J14DRAFT_642773 [Halenospora varia]
MQYSLGLIGLLSLLPAIIGNPLPGLRMSPVPRQVQLHDPSQECCKVNCHLENVGDGNMHTDWLHTNGKDGENVCVWMAVGHAAYTVQPNTHGYPPICKWNGNLIVKSPLTNNPGGGFYCVRGNACRAINDHYWCLGQKEC